MRIRTKTQLSFDRANDQDHLCQANSTIKICHLVETSTLLIKLINRVTMRITILVCSLKPFKCKEVVELSFRKKFTRSRRLRMLIFLNLKKQSQYWIKQNWQKRLAKLSWKAKLSKPMHSKRNPKTWKDWVNLEARKT